MTATPVLSWPDQYPELFAEGAVFEARDLRRTVELRTGRRQILSLEHLAIPRGRVTCIVGDSGCGKTTLLSILGLVDLEFEVPEEGSFQVQLDGPQVEPIEFGHLSPRRRRRFSTHLRRKIGFVFQDGRLRRDVDAVENIIDPLVHLGVGNRRTRREVAAQALTRFGLQKKVEVRDAVASFSGGEQQRTAIARAWATSPRLILADEPTANVDSTLADDIYGELVSLARGGVTVVIVTHDRYRADKYADFILRFESSAGGGYELHPSVPPPSNVEVPAPHGLPVDTLRPSGSLAVWGDVWRDTIRTYRPVLEAVRRAPGALVRAVTFRRTHVSNNPNHLWLPQVAAFLTFTALAAMGFFFVSVRYAIVAYEHSVLEELSTLRRLRMTEIGTPAAEEAKLKAEDLVKWLEDHGAPKLDFYAERNDLSAYLLSPDDRSYVEENRRFSSALLDAMWLEPDEDPLKADDQPRRYGMNVFALAVGDPLAHDLSVSEAYSEAHTGGTTPTIFVDGTDPGRWTRGGWPESGAAKAGDEVWLAFTAAPLLDPANPPVHALQVANADPRLVTCVRFRVLDQLYPLSFSADSSFRIEHRNVDAAIHPDAFTRLVRWRADPLNTPLPSEWTCGLEREVGSMRYSGEQVASEPRADAIDLFALNVEELPELVKSVDRFAVERGYTYRPEWASDAIQRVSDIVRVVDLVGMVLVVVPILVGSVVVWLVVHGTIDRRRSQLFLYAIMGARRWYLYAQALLLALALALPALVVGWFVGGQAPSWILRALEGLSFPVGLQEAIANANSGWIGLASVGTVVVVLCTLTAVGVVRSVLDGNPADYFRGL